MFETLFQYPLPTAHVRMDQSPAKRAPARRSIVARHRRGPSAEARERIPEPLRQPGLGSHDLAALRLRALVIAERIDVTTGDAIESSAIEAAAGLWAREQ